MAPPSTEATTLRPTGQPGVRASAPVRAYVALLGGVLGIGVGPLLVRFADTTSDVIGLFRMTVAALVLAGPALLNWRRGRARLPRSLLAPAVLGGLVFAANIFAWNAALNLTTVANATFLDHTASLWVGLGAWLLFGERLRARYWLGLGVALAGAAILTGLDGFDGSTASIGDLLALAGALMYASYLLLTQRVRKQVDNLTYLWLFSAVGAAAFLVINLALNNPVTGLPLRSYAAMVGIALLSQVMGWLLINYALGHLRASLVAVALLGQPVLATLLAAPLLGETLGPLQIVGGAVTLAGIAIVQTANRQGG